MKSTAILLVTALATPATAAPVFHFTQTSSTPPGALTASADLVLSDAAFASGFSIHRTSTDGLSTPILAGSGVLSLDFLFVGSLAMEKTASDFAYRPAGPTGPLIWHVDLGSRPFDTPAGGIYFNDGQSDFTFNFSTLGLGSGDFNTDFTFGFPGCSRSGLCHFAGTWADPVPEPMSLAMLGMAWLGLVAIRRK